MGKLVTDCMTLVFALVMVAIRHEDPATARVEILADAKQCLVDLPPGPVKNLIDKVPAPVGDYLLGLAADTAIHLIDKTPLFQTGASA